MNKNDKVLESNDVFVLSLPFTTCLTCGRFNTMGKETKDGYKPYPTGYECEDDIEVCPATYFYLAYGNVTQALRDYKTAIEMKDPKAIAEVMEEVSTFSRTAQDEFFENYEKYAITEGGVTAGIIVNNANIDKDVQDNTSEQSNNEG